jgi:NADPH:quinone reductase-like Zn-dependent oxidoreductase
MSSELGPYGQNPLLSLINPLQRIFTKRNIAFPTPKTRLKEAQTIKEHLKNGTYKPLIDKRYNLEDIIQAFEYVESGQKVGNVTIKVC